MPAFQFHKSKSLQVTIHVGRTQVFRAEIGTVVGAWDFLDPYLILFNSILDPKRSDVKMSDAANAFPRHGPLGPITVHLQLDVLDVHAKVF